LLTSATAATAVLLPAHCAAAAVKWPMTAALLPLALLQTPSKQPSLFASLPLLLLTVRKHSCTGPRALTSPRVASSGLQLGPAECSHPEWLSVS